MGWKSDRPPAACRRGTVGGEFYVVAMRLLHTSDWHIGRTFHGHSLLGDQEEVLTALAEQVRERRVDVVLIAGDLFDRPVPSVDAVALATRALGRIRKAGAQIVLSSGNHDSAARLGAFAEFLAAGGLHIRTDIPQLDAPVLLDDEFGTVALYAIPYLDPDVARSSLGAPQVVGHAGVLGEAMRRIRADLASRDAGTRSVVLAHAFVVGGAPTESERSLDGTPSRSVPTPVARIQSCNDAVEPITGSAKDVSSFGVPSSQKPVVTPCEQAVPVDSRSVTFKRGTVGSVPGSIFEDVDYVALGHLHRRQQLSTRLRYSGSPLPYSFSEAGQRKGSWLVDLNAVGLATVIPLDLPVIRQLATLRDSLDALLLDRRYEQFRNDYLAVELTDSARQVDAMRKLAGRFSFVAKLEYCNEMQSSEGKNPVATGPVPDADLVEDFLRQARGTGLSRDEAGLIRQAFAALAASEAAA
jgi:exonuclease SbcD